MFADYNLDPIARIFARANEATVAETLTPQDIKHLDETWKQTYVGTLMSCVAQQQNREDRDTFDLDEVKGPVKL